MALTVARAAPPDTGMQLRIVWGGGARVAWRGHIQISNGSLRPVRSLGLDEDVPGSFLSDGDTIPIASSTPRVFDGMDVSVQAPLSAVLTVELSPGDSPAETLRVPLTELLRHPAAQTLDSAGNSVHIQRTPGDALRIQWHSDHLVFDPSESWRLRVTPALLGVAEGTQLDLNARIVRKGSDDVLWRANEPLVATAQGTEPEAIRWDIQVPAEEGVYQLELTIERAGRKTFWVDQPVVERVVQFVVVDPRATAGGGTADWQDVAVYNPAESRWWERLVAQVPTLPQLPGTQPRLLGSTPGDTAVWDGIRFSRLGPGGWQAYPLPIHRPGQPHLVEVAYPADHAQVLGVTAVEADAAGHVAQLNPETCIAVASSEVAPSGERRLQFIIWPKSNEPYLLLTNRHGERDALFGEIRVGYLEGPLPDLLDAGNSGAAPAGSGTSPSLDGPQTSRRAWAYFDRPVFPETFSAAQSADPGHGRVADDWETFLVGTIRMAEYLKHVGYDGATLAVWSEGSSIYPSELLDPTPKYDTGAYFSTGQDPQRKDVLELMFRVFQREGLTLVPMLQFSGPLPELEKQRRMSDGSADGIVLLDTSGRRYQPLNTPADRGASPYNPLDERVQEQMVRVVQELAARYGHHASFGGVHIPLADGHSTHLPDVTWGADRFTVQRFLERELPEEKQQPDARPLSNDHAVSASAVLQEPQRSAWIQWRADCITDMYRHMSERVQQHAPHARLYLSPTGLMSSPAMRRALGPNLLSDSSIVKSLMEMGIDIEQLSKEPAVVLSRTQVHAPLEPLSQRGPNLEWNASRVVDEIGRNQTDRAALFYHHPSPLRLQEFDEHHPFGDKDSATWLVPQVTPAGERNRQRLIHSLVARDTNTFMDGGWTMLRGQPDTIRELLDQYRRLPATAFHTYEPAQGTTSPLTIRFHSEGEHSYIYIVNDSPWPTQAELILTSLEADKLSSLSPRVSLGQVEPHGEALRWSVALDGYALIAAVAQSSSVQIANVEVRYDAEVVPLLRERLTALSGRVASLSSPRNMDVLTNPGFEAKGSRNMVSGWEAATGPGIRCGTDAVIAHGGKYSYRAESDGPVVWVRSAPFAAPTTGRLALSMWLRGDADEPSPPLRLAIEGKLAGKTYYRHAPIERETGDSALSAEWTQFVLRVDDLPPEDLEELRVGFDLMGPGTVWVDDIEVHDLSFTRGERIELSKAIAVAELQLSRGQVAECWQTLHRYWPHFLEQHLPVPTQSVAPAEAAPTSTNANQVGKRPRNGKMMDRVRRMIPSIRR